ncbi:MAG: YdcF family protein [Bacteroidota bacterium]
MTTPKKILKYLFYLLVIWMLVHIAITITNGLKDHKEQADYAVILGNKVNTDGSLSERLTKRLKCGLNLYNTKRIKGIIVSGGLGKEGYYEGDKMKDFLIRNGVPDSVIVVDNKGDNTLKTVENVMLMKSGLKFKTLIVVSQYYHITRTKMLFKKKGFTSVSGASPSYFEWRDLYSLVREFFAYYLELI